MSAIFSKYRGALTRGLSYVLLLTVCTFALLWAGNTFSNAGSSVTRYMASLQAPFTGWFYADRASDQITVILYDDAFLKEQGASWPISYLDHADWIERLTSASEIPPKAIFVDITFAQRREDSTVTTLYDTLCAIHDRQNIPIYLIASFDDKGRPGIRPELAPQQGDRQQPCYSLVDATYTQDKIDKLAWNYPLTINNGGAVVRSPAAAMAEDVANIKGLSDADEPTSFMALEWATRRHDWPDNWDKPAGFTQCRGFTQNIPGYLPWVSNLTGNQETNLCPYHRTLSMQHVSAMDSDTLAPFVQDKYLLIGAQVASYNDFIDSPINNLMPGIYLHAMALDNLLTYKSHYKQNKEWFLLPGWDMLFAVLLVVLIAYAVRLFGQWLQRRLSQAMGQRWQLPPNSFWARILTIQADAVYDLPTRSARFCGMLVHFVLWLLVILAKIIAIMLLVILIQKIFRVGMLPLIELTGMVVLAEALDVAEKLKLLFNGRKTKGVNT